MAAAAATEFQAPLPADKPAAGSEMGGSRTTEESATAHHASSASSSPPATEEEARERAAVEAFQAGEAFMGAGDANTALICFMRAAEALPGWPDAWMRLGVCFHRLRRYQQACSALRHGLEVGAWEELPAILTYMDTLRELGSLGRILEAAEHVPAASPFGHFAALISGWAAHARNGPEAAERHFAAAAAAEPGNALYAYLRARAAALNGPCEFTPPVDLSEAAEDDMLLVQLHRAQHHLDVPGLCSINDKVSLHRLLVAAPGSNGGDGAPASVGPATAPSSTGSQLFWPRGYVLPGDLARAEAEEDEVVGSLNGSHLPRWVRKTRNGMGGLGARQDWLRVTLVTGTGLRHCSILAKAVNSDHFLSRLVCCGACCSGNTLTNSCRISWYGLGVERRGVPGGPN